MRSWLAFSEPAGRAPHVILEHRNFVKKLIFPLATLPVNQVLAGLVTEIFATAIFLIALLLTGSPIHPSVLWLPVLLIPQLLFTTAICCSPAALGVLLPYLAPTTAFPLPL